MSIVLVSSAITGPVTVGVADGDYRSYLTASRGAVGRITASVNGSAFIEDVPLVEGTLSVHRGTGLARSLKATVRVNPGDPVIDPHATEWKAEYGLTLPGGTLWVTVGTFVLTDVEESSGTGQVTIAAVDRWVRVARARFERARVTSGNTAEAIAALMGEADHRIAVDISRAPVGTHRPTVWERDRDKAVQDLARSIGAQVRFNPDGVAVVSPAPSLSDAAFWTVHRGRDGAKIGATIGASTETAYNAVVVTGETPGGAPIYHAVRNTDPASGQVYGGLAGRVPRFYTSDRVTSQGQAEAAAEALLAAGRRAVRTLSLDALPHPGLDSGNVLSVETQPATWERHMVTEYDLPLGRGPVSIKASNAGDYDDETE